MKSEGPNSRRAGPLPRLLNEMSGACGDLGTLLPYALGAIMVAGMSATAVLLGFGGFLIAAGMIYQVPMAVQPMKAIGAVVMAGDLSSAEIAVAGALLGIILTVGALTGMIQRLARLVPRSVTAGLQLGLGAVMVAIGLALMADQALLGAVFLAALVLLTGVPGVPAALVVATSGVAVGLYQGSPPPQVDSHSAGLAEFMSVDPWSVLAVGVLPQLSLTLTNAIIVTAAVSRDLFGPAAQKVTERRLSLTSGIANLLLVPLGALPMCHGAGGVAAQHRFGARTGLAPILLGACLILIAVGAGSDAVAYLSLIPSAALGALLVVAGVDLALSPRMFDARPECRPAIALTAIATVAFNPALALAAGWLWESGRSRLRRGQARG